MESISSLPRGLTRQPDAKPNAEEQVQKAEDAEEMRRSVLATLIDAPARERISRIALVDAERARRIEEILCKMAQIGSIRVKVTEEQLIELITQMDDPLSKKTTKKTTIVYQRRRDFDDDDF